MLQNLLKNTNSTVALKAMESSLAQVIYGSHLYGTSSPTSDRDFKVIYVPTLDSVLLGEKFTNFKVRFNANGELVGDEVAMTDAGTEIEFIALQTYLRDFLAGQTYAVETAFAIDQGFTLEVDETFKEINYEMIQNFQSNSISSMVGFAMKQTFDYVHRGERLNEALFFHKLLTAAVREMGGIDPSHPKELRLDTPLSMSKWITQETCTFPEGTVYDFIESGILSAGMQDSIKSTKTHNVNKTQRSFTFGGRQYLETTPVSELLSIVKKRIESYGTRSKSAAESDVDPKSLMHAIRVYQQAIELLTTGSITFPRPNSDSLLRVRNLEIPMEEIRGALVELDVFVQNLQTEHPPMVDELRDDFKLWTLAVLREFYGLDGGIESDSVGSDDAMEVLTNLQSQITDVVKDVRETVSKIYQSPEVQTNLRKMKNFRVDVSKLMK